MANHWEMDPHIRCYYFPSWNVCWAPCRHRILPVQVIPVSRATREVRRSRGFAANELVFQMQAPPLGFTTYMVTLQKNFPRAPPPNQRTPAVIQNQVCWTAASLWSVAVELRTPPQLPENHLHFCLRCSEHLLKVLKVIHGWKKNLWWLSRLEVHIRQHVMTVCYMWTHHFWFHHGQFVKVTFDTTTGLLSDLTNLETGQSIKLKQNFYWSVTHFYEPEVFIWIICSILLISG